MNKKENNPSFAQRDAVSIEKFMAREQELPRAMLAKTLKCFFNNQFFKLENTNKLFRKKIL